MWTLGEMLLLYSIVQVLQNNNLEIMQEIIRAGLNNRVKSLMQIKAKLTYMPVIQHPQ